MTCGLSTEPNQHKRILKHEPNLSYYTKTDFSHGSFLGRKDNYFPAVFKICIPEHV